MTKKYSNRTAREICMSQNLYMQNLGKQSRDFKAAKATDNQTLSLATIKPRAARGKHKSQTSALAE